MSANTVAAYLNCHQCSGCFRQNRSAFTAILKSFYSIPTVKKILLFQEKKQYISELTYDSKCTGDSQSSIT